MKIPKDKKAHFIMGAVAATVVTLLTGNPLWGTLAAVVVGAAKEGYDATGRGTVDVWDFIATATGAVVVIPLMFFL